MVRRIRKEQCKIRKKRQRDGFLNRYHLAYAGRNTVNTAMRSLNQIAPKNNKRSNRSGRTRRAKTYATNYKPGRTTSRKNCTKNNKGCHRRSI